MVKETSKDSKLKKLIQTHSRWLTIAGAGIVFAMFVVKDAYRESMKDIVSSISEVEGSFDTNLKIQRMGEILQVMRDDAEMKKPKSQIEALYETLALDPEAVLGRKNLESYYDLEASSLALSHLMESLPSQIRDEKKPDLNRITHMIQVGITQRTDKHPRSNLELVDLDVNDAMAIKYISQDLKDLQRYVLLSSERERQALERRLHSCTIASYVLYPVGWLIGLIGKLYGIPEAADLE